MAESGEWFSPRTRPEMLTSDDPPVPSDKPELVQILPGPATTVGRAVAPLRRLVWFVPEIGRRIVRVDDVPSRWQLAGMWATGSAIVAATGLAVATVLGGAPPALTQPFERLAVLPGIDGPHDSDRTVTSADKASGDSAPSRERASAVESHTGSRSSYTVDGNVPSYPEDLVPGQPLPASAGGSAGSGSGSVAGGGRAPVGGGSAPVAPAPPAGGGATTPPATSPATPPASEPTEEPPTEPATPPTEDPTTPPTEDPTEPATPPEDPPPPDTPPADPPAEPPVDQPADPPADPPVAETPPDDPAPPATTPTDPSPVTP